MLQPSPRAKTHKKSKRPSRPPKEVRSPKMPRRKQPKKPRRRQVANQKAKQMPATPRNPRRMKMISSSSWILRSPRLCGLEAPNPHRKMLKSWVRLASNLSVLPSTPICSPGGLSLLSSLLMHAASGQPLRQQQHPRKRRSLRKSPKRSPRRRRPRRRTTTSTHLPMTWTMRKRSRWNA